MGPRQLSDARLSSNPIRYARQALLRNSKKCSGGGREVRQFAKCPGVNWACQCTTGFACGSMAAHMLTRYLSLPYQDLPWMKQVDEARWS